MSEPKKEVSPSIIALSNHLNLVATSHGGIANKAAQAPGIKHLMQHLSTAPKPPTAV